MARSIRTSRDQVRSGEAPVAWFSELLIAFDRGDFRRASEAQGRLAQLGWAVARSAENDEKKGGGR